MPDSLHEDQIATLLSLPPEIFDTIANQTFESASLGDLHSCALVCKIFHATFRPMVFRYVDLLHYNSPPFDLHRRFAELLAMKPEIGGYVRCIRAMAKGAINEWDLEPHFPAIADRLTNLQSFELHTHSVAFQETWANTNSALRKGLVSILTSPSLRSVTIRGNIAFIIPHRLLFSSPALGELDISMGRERFAVGHSDIEYWQALDASYDGDSAGVDRPTREPSPPSSALRLLTFHITMGPPKTNWLQYLMDTQPTYFSSLTLTGGVKQPFLPLIQSILGSSGRLLKRLDLDLCLLEPFIDLSRNTGLEALRLQFSSAHYIDRTYRGTPHDRLPSIANTLLTLDNAASLHTIALHVHWACPGPHLDLHPNFPKSPLLHLDECFAQLSRRHPQLRVVELSFKFGHSRPCNMAYGGGSPRCTVWDEIFTSASDAFRESHFPFLTLHKPTELKVTLLHE